ncbi:MAG: hypothetical protein ABEH61_00395 [Haloarculaceae archaeon]
MSSSTGRHDDPTPARRAAGNATDEEQVVIAGGSIVSDTAASELIDEVTDAVDDAITGAQAETNGFEFVGEPEHHDPVVRATKAYERGELSIGPLSDDDIDRLKSFVARAEAGAFEVRENPKIEATVRIARLLVCDHHGE